MVWPTLGSAGCPSCRPTNSVKAQAGCRPACKKTKWWGAGVVVCLEKGADLHMVQLMELPLTVSCFSKIQIGFTFLVPAPLGSPGKRAVKWVCVCVERVCAVYKVCNTKPFQYCYVTSTMMY